MWTDFFLKLNALWPWCGALQVIFQKLTLLVQLQRLDFVFSVVVNKTFYGQFAQLLYKLTLRFSVSVRDSYL